MPGKRPYRRSAVLARYFSDFPTYRGLVWVFADDRLKSTVPLAHNASRLLGTPDLGLETLRIAQAVAPI